MVPVDEYERMELAQLAAEAMAALQDPKTKWVDYDAVKLQWAGQRIAEARKARGWSQAELGKRMGLAQTQISRIERNPDSSTLRTLKKVAAALGVDVRGLIG